MIGTHVGCSRTRTSLCITTVLNLGALSTMKVNDSRATKGPTRAKGTVYGGKISNFFERKEAHLKVLPWQQLGKSRILQQYRYSTVKWAMFNIAYLTILKQ